MTEISPKKVAVILFNLGGPSDLDAVQPFLFNLFNDPAIIALPNPFRWLIAKLVSIRRAPFAREIYKKMGGKSPLLQETEAQAKSLEALLSKTGSFKCFIAMRYWHPMTEKACADVKAWQPDEIILLPLYPQFSTTSTGSSLKAWNLEAKRIGLTVPARTICCYPDQKNFIAAHVDLLEQAVRELTGKRFRILFSAHGLPKKIVEKGDPYQLHVEMTVDAALMALRDKLPAGDELDHVVCYQSRVGPMEWITPSTIDEINRAGGDGRSIIMVPIAFVSEHSETLVELDEEYHHLAQEAGVPDYLRLPALGVRDGFINGLADLVQAGLKDEFKVGQVCAKLGRNCPAKASF